jgi:hypothetical protein
MLEQRMSRRGRSAARPAGPASTTAIPMADLPVADPYTPTSSGGQWSSELALARRLIAAVITIPVVGKAGDVVGERTQTPSDRSILTDPWSPPRIGLDCGWCRHCSRELRAGESFRPGDGTCVAVFRLAERFFVPVFS